MFSSNSKKREKHVESIFKIHLLSCALMDIYEKKEFHINALKQGYPQFMVSCAMAFKKKKNKYGKYIVS